MASPRMTGVARASTFLTLSGRYRLLEVVGSGARGRVWRAFDELLDRQVAIKELAGPARRGSAAGLDDPGLLRTFDVVRSTGRSWLVMEYVPSLSLFDRVSESGALSHREALSAGLGMARALEAVHAAGILHLGIEPHRVLMADDGRVVLTDTGVALTAVLPGATSGTQPLFGPRHYTAPEVRAGDVATAASDLWSLGATLYTAVEGYPPLFRAGPGLGTLSRPRNPGPLHTLIADLLAADPAARPTAAATRVALQRLADRAIGVSAVPVPPPCLSTDEVAGVEPASRKYRRRAAVLSIAAVTVAAAAVAVVTMLPVRGFLGLGKAPASSVAGPPLSSGPCVGATPQSVTDDVGAQTPVLPGWRSHADPAGFALSVPADWTRATLNDVVCYSGPGELGVFSVDAEVLNDDGPLLHWQSAEITALADGSLPGYQRVSMNALTGGGADWEYTWQPATGPRLHTRRVLPPDERGIAEGLAWTTPDTEWAATATVQRDIVAGFRDTSEENAQTP